MKHRTIAVIFVLVGIFLLFNANDGISGAAENTVKLMVPNLPTGG
jgi:hypothetical protein